MKKLNTLTKPLTGLDGEPVMSQLGTNLVPETVGRMMANVLARAQSDDPVKAMMIAMQIHGAKSVDLEDADFDLLNGAVREDKLLTNLGKAALLTALEGAKDMKQKQ